MNENELKEYLKANLRLKKTMKFSPACVEPFNIIQLWLGDELITSEVL